MYKVSECMGVWVYCVGLFTTLVLVLHYIVYNVEASPCNFLWTASEIFNKWNRAQFAHLYRRVAELVGAEVAELFAANSARRAEAGSRLAPHFVNLRRTCDAVRGRTCARRQTERHRGPSLLIRKGHQMSPFMRISSNSVVGMKTDGWVFTKYCEWIK